MKHQKKTPLRALLGYALAAILFSAFIAPAGPITPADAASTPWAEGQIPTNLPAAPSGFDSGATAYTTSSVNLRTGPSGTTTKLLTIPKGTQLTITSTSGNWSQTTYKNKTGWLNNPWLTTTPPMVVSTSQVNMRSQPNTSSTIIRKVENGAKLTTHKRSENWYQVTYGGSKGWVSQSYTRPPRTGDIGKRISSGYNRTFSGAQYHIYADSINWSKPVGILYYFDGDYYAEYAAMVGNPSGSKMKDLAKVAAAENRVLVAPKTPSPRTSANGYTWWEKPATNARWFRRLASHLEGQIKPNRIDIWYAGYSGGAQLISQETAARNRKGQGYGGAVLIAGGDKPVRYTTPPTSFKREISMHWYVGALDVSGQTNPPSWSALTATRDSYNFYSGKGYKTNLTIIPGAGHHDYRIASLVEDAMKKG